MEVKVIILKILQFSPQKSLPNFIDCVRWSSRGDRLATTPWNSTVKVLDFASAKVYYAGFTSGKGKVFFLVTSMILIL